MPSNELRELASQLKQIILQADMYRDYAARAYSRDETESAKTEMKVLKRTIISNIAKARRIVKKCARMHANC